MEQKEKKSKLKISPLRILIILFSGLLLGICIYFINASAFAGDSVPMPFGVGAGVVLSGSMEPELSVDDLIIVRRADEYNVGDVVVYRRRGSSVVHRIVIKDGKNVVTQGDANNAADEPISPSDISGRVVCSIPKAGRVVGFFQSPIGVIVILGIALLLLELSFRSEKDRGSRELEDIKEEIRRLREAGGAGSSGDSADTDPTRGRENTEQSLDG